MSVSVAPTKTRGNLVANIVAGLTTGVANIPDALALAVLAGANPVQGLYALMAGTPLAAIFGSSAFMNVSATSALAIAAGMALTDYTGDAHATAIATLTLLTGLIMLLAGLLKLGRLLRFVANSVVIGFLTGVSINVILSQLGDFTGYFSEYRNNVIEAIDTVLHLGQINLQTTAIGALTVAVILLVDRTRLRNFSLLVGMVAGSAALIVLNSTSMAGWKDVQQVNDIAVIPTVLPLPKLPDFKLVPDLMLDALVLAIIGLVQGAGVSKTYANPDGDYPNTSRDFIGQGAANIGAGLLQGIPIGGAIASTALNKSAGAKSRWANIFSGLLVAVVVLLFSRAVSLVAMPAMAGLLILTGYHSIKSARIKDIWAIGWSGRVVMLVTLAFTLAIPLQWAVFLGVLLSILVHFFVTSSEEVRLMQLTPNPDGTVTESPVPAELAGNAVTLMQIYGNMTFAGAETLELLLPTPKTSERPVVILRLRAQESIGSSFIGVLERYAQQLKAHGGKLMVAGVNPKVKGQLAQTGTVEEFLGGENVFLSSSTLGASTRDAYAAAERWLQEQEESQDTP